MKYRFLISYKYWIMGKTGFDIIKNIDRGFFPFIMGNSTSQKVSLDLYFCTPY